MRSSSVRFTFDLFGFLAPHEVHSDGRGSVSASSSSVVAVALPLKRNM